MAPSSDNTRRGYRTLSFWIAVVMVTILDQATKAVVKELLQVDGARCDFIPGIMELRLVHNTGAAFSIGEGAGIVFIILAAVVLIMMAAFVWRNPDLPLSLTISLGCVAGGGVGNMIDRIIDGAVTDFFATTFIDFAVFNVADIFVTCGLVITFILFMRFESKSNEDV